MPQPGRSREAQLAQRLAKGAWVERLPLGHTRYSLATPADTCEADCVRKRAEQSLQAAIKTLRKSIGRQQFSVQVAGTEYEVAQRPARALESPGTCGTGQVLQDGKCGESLPTATQGRSADVLCPCFCM